MLYSRTYLGKCILACLFILTMIYPILFRLNLSSSNYEQLDIVDMVSPYAWVYLVVMCALLCAHVMLSRTFGLLQLFLGALLLYGLFFVSQYPTPLQVDAVIHSGGARQVIAYGSTSFRKGYVNSWPASFVLVSTLSSMTSLNVMDASFLLAFFAMSFTVILLYLLGRLFVKPEWAGLPGLLLLVGNCYAFQYLDRDRFSPFSMSYVLFMLSFYVVLRAYHKKLSRSYSAILFITIAMVSLSHVFVPMFLFFAVAALELSKRFKRSSRSIYLSYLLFTGVLWIIWWISYSYSTFEDMISVVSRIFAGGEPTKIMGVAKFVEPSADLARFLSFYYFRAAAVAVILLALLTIIRKRSRRSPLHVSLVLSALAFSAVTLLSPRTESSSYVVQWSRVLPLSLLPMALVGSTMLIGNRSRPKIVAFLLIALIIPSFLTSLSFLSVYVEAVHPWETQGMQFLAAYSVNPMILGSDISVRMYSSYFDIKGLASSNEVSLMRIDYSKILENNPLLFEGDTIFRSFRQDLVSRRFIGSSENATMFWTRVDKNLDSFSHIRRLYDNGYVRIYR